MIGAEIPARYLEHQPDHDAQVEKYGKCYCRPWGDKTHYSRVIGHEVPEIYDGVLFWSCPDCGKAWPRDFGNTNRTEVSSDYVERFNKQE